MENDKLFISEKKYIYISLDGYFNSLTAEKFDEYVSKYDDVDFMIIDMTNLKHISNMGFKSLLNLKNRLLKNDGKLKIINTNNYVYELFEFTGYTDILDVN